jgi:hypothetical protein
MDATGKISALVGVLIRDARAKESLAKTPANLLKMQSAAIDELIKKALILSPDQRARMVVKDLQKPVVRGALELEVEENEADSVVEEMKLHELKTKVKLLTTQLKRLKSKASRFSQKDGCAKEKDGFSAIQGSIDEGRAFIFDQGRATPEIVNTWFEETFEETIAAATDGTQTTEDLLNRTLMYIIYEYIGSIK